MPSISEKHSRAARANGARSRGPVTPEGKSISARNATRHGLLAQIVLLSHEDAPVFEALFNQLVDRFSPVDDVELSAVEEMAAAHWRLRRNLAIERALLESAVAQQPKGACTAGLAAVFADPASLPSLTLLQRYETRLQNIYQRAIRTLNLLRKTPKSAPQPPPPSVPNEPITPNVCAAKGAQPAPLPPPDPPNDPPSNPPSTTITATGPEFAPFPAFVFP